MRRLHAVLAGLFLLSPASWSARAADDDRRTVEDLSAARAGMLATGEARVPGPFQPTYESLKAYRCPEWYRDAKFGIWAHWGPQGVAGCGDWYARNMYVEGSGTYKYHLEHYGHPSRFGYKDIIGLWRAENFDPDRLMALYKRAGAKYFVSMGCHHDNFDLWDSKFHRWNAVNMGPRKDIVGLWRAAALKQGLRFGVSEHMAPSFKWFSVAHSADKSGPYAGVPYDGNQPENFDLYGPQPEKIWSAGAELWQESGMPDRWKEEWFRRCNDLLEHYRPDYVYSDYGNVPFRREAGWQLLANYYNRNMADHGGRLEAVYTGKGEKDRVYVRDFESGAAGAVQAEPWQMDWCIANFFYDRNLKVRTADTVIRLLVDVVSKNGNLLLSVPQKPDGSLDAQTENFLSGMAGWMGVNGEAIFGSRPFKVSGEGPTHIQDFRTFELPYTAKDIRFTVKGDTLYAIVMGVPEREVTVETLASGTPLVQGEIASIKLLGYSGSLKWHRDDRGLTISLPPEKPNQTAFVFQLTGLHGLGFDGLIYPDKNGTFELAATSAARHGTKFGLADGHISGWMDGGEWLSWDVMVARPGTYDVNLLSSAAGGDSDVIVSVDDVRLAGRFPKSSNWEDFAVKKIGQVTVGKSGKATVALRPADPKSWRPLNLKSVTLSVSLPSAAAATASAAAQQQEIQQQ